MKRAAPLAGILMASACPVWAQAPLEAPSASASITANPVAAARAEADRLIAAAHAEIYFSNVTTDATPRVRHLPSGLECSFNLGQPNSIEVYQTNAKPGEDVGCGTRHPLKDGRFAVETLYAARYARTPTLQQSIDGMVASIRIRSPEAKAATGSFTAPAAGPDAAPPYAAVRLELGANPQRLFTRAATGVVKGWVISQRITAPIDDAKPADAIGEHGMASATAQVQRAVIDDADIAARQIAAQDAASDEAHRLLKGIRNPEAFANLTAEGVVRLQHRASGAICRFGRDPRVNSLVQLPNGFSCAYGRDFGAESLEVSYMPGVTGGEAAALVAKFVAAQYPDAQPMTGFGDVKASAPKGLVLPDHVSQRLGATTNTGLKVFVRLSYAVVGDWMVFQRIVSPVNNARLVDLQGERNMIEGIFQVANRQTQAPRLDPPTKGR